MSGRASPSPTAIAPAAFAAASRTSPEILARIRAGFEQALGEPMAAGELAKRVLAGIEADDFYILSHPDLNEPVRARVASVERAARAAA